VVKALSSSAVDVGGSGRVELGHLLFSFGERVLFLSPSSGERMRRMLCSERSAALAEPFVGLLDQRRAGEADRCLVIGEDADDVGAAADLLVDPVERIGVLRLIRSSRGRP
jgi:hypothetical protein